jgi:hypothetical protein
MTEMKVTDEMLMAYADGELDGAEKDTVARLAATDPLIAARIARFARSRQAVKEAFAPIHAEPVPPALVAAVLGSGGEKPAQDNPILRWLVPVAATLVVVAGVGGYFAGTMGSATSDGGFMAAATGTAVTDALAMTPSGTEVSVSSAGYAVTASATGTYQTDGGMCRIYEASSDGQFLRGITCTSGEGWSVPVATLEQAGETYRPASEAGLYALDAFLDGVGAGGDIGDAAEQDMIARGWQ